MNKIFLNTYGMCPDMHRNQRSRHFGMANAQGLGGKFPRYTLAELSASLPSQCSLPSVIHSILFSRRGTYSRHREFCFHFLPTSQSAKQRLVLCKDLIGLPFKPSCHLLVVCPWSNQFANFSILITKMGIMASHYVQEHNESCTTTSMEPQGTQKASKKCSFLSLIPTNF